MSRAVKYVFDQPLIQRCRQHKIKNVRDKLPERLRAVAERRMRQAYYGESALKAAGLLAALEASFTENVTAANLNEDQHVA